MAGGWKKSKRDCRAYLENIHARVARRHAEIRRVSDFRSMLAHLSRIRVVLTRTSHPGNIGAAARAMKTMGLTRLFLVDPQCQIDGQARAMASNALDVLGRATHCASLAQALDGCVLVAGLTARRREYAAPFKWARDAAPEVIAAAAAGEVALVFGNETSGLSNDELAQCRLPVAIPTDAQFSSLNLAAAVQVMCYELRLAAREAAPASASADVPASHQDIQRFYAHLEDRKSTRLNSSHQ